MSTVVIFFISPSPSRCWQSPVWGSLESHFGVVASGVWCQDSDQIGATDQMGHPQYCRLGRLFIISPCQSWVERFGAKYSIINIRSQGQCFSCNCNYHFSPRKIKTSHPTPRITLSAGVPRFLPPQMRTHTHLMCERARLILTHLA